jgi:SAM-dependent methyltransferase
MLRENVSRVEASILPSDRVLDIGAWFVPFARADYVVDLMPFETRGYGGPIGVGPERFSAATWITHDVSSSAPLPFPDKSFDYVICSHTLEDIRDPMHLCAEIQRIGRRGYIEVPSRIAESVMAAEGRRYAGLYHHRWLVDIEGDEITFRFKSHLIHESRRFHIPKRALRSLSDSDQVAWMFWEDQFRYREVVQISKVETEKELAAFVDRHAPLSTAERLLDALKSRKSTQDFIRLHPRLGILIRRTLRRDFQPIDPFWIDMPEIECR